MVNNEISAADRKAGKLYYVYVLVDGDADGLQCGHTLAGAKALAEWYRNNLRAEGFHDCRVQVLRRDNSEFVWGCD